MFFESIRKRMSGIVVFIALAFVVTLLYTGLGDTTQQAQAQTTVAIVNGKKITNIEVENQYLGMVGSGFTGGLNDEQLRYVAFQDVVNYYLVVDAARAEGIEVDAAEIDSLIENSIPPGVTLRQLLASRGITEKEYREAAEEYLLVIKIEDARRAEIDIDEAEVEQQFEEMLASGQHEQVRARHILIGPTDSSDPASWDSALEQIEAMRAEIVEGELFERMAAEQSHDTGSAILGGDLGFFGRGQMVRPFEEAAFSLEIGELSEPIRSDFGYHLIEVTHKRDLTDPDYAKSQKDRIREALRSEAMNEHFGVWMDELWEKADFDVIDVRLKAHQTLRDGDMETAASLFKEAIREHPDNGALHLLLAQLYDDLDNKEAALEQYRAATALLRSDANAYMALGIALVEAGEKEEAEAALIRASELATIAEPYQALLIQLQVQQALTQLDADDDVLASIDERIQDLIGGAFAPEDVLEDLDLDAIDIETDELNEILTDD